MAARSEFIHLHLHTQYSLLDGAIRIDQLIKRAEELGMMSLAMTDHGNLFGAVEFYRAVKYSGIKPIIGCEVYVTEGSRLGKPAEEDISDSYYHLTLLAKDNTGYKNLIKLVSIGYLEGFQHRPCVDREIFSKYSEGLIALSGCMKGEVSSFLLQDRNEEALKTVEFYKSLMGEGNYFLEIQNHGIPEQKSLNKKLVELGKTISVPIVATNDCHYMDRSDAKAHDVLLCIQTGKKISDENRKRFPTDQFYFRSPQEMKILFSEIPEAISNTLEIADRCNLEMRFDQTYLPKYEVPADITSYRYLEQKAIHGLEKRFKECAVDDQKKSDYVRRLNQELEIIGQKGVSDYFLIVCDFIEYAKSKNIPVGPGKYAAPASLIAYVLHITDIDPIEHGLLFERFLNPELKNLPDICTDFCKYHKNEVIKYVIKKYGKEKVSKIINFRKMNARSTFTKVGNVMEIDSSELDKAAKLIPNNWWMKIKEAVEEEKRLEMLVKSDDKLREIIEISQTLQGLPYNILTHATGIVIAPEPLINYLPVCVIGDEIATQFVLNEVEKIGLQVIMFFGLEALTTMRGTEKKIQIKNKDFNIETIPLEDTKTYGLLGTGKTIGLFKPEYSEIGNILKKYKPETFKELMTFLALNRPGPIEIGMPDNFIKRKRSALPVQNIIPELNEILNETYGIIVYQDQVLKIANVVGGFSIGVADLMRRAFGKSKPEELAHFKKMFIQGAIEKKIDSKKAETIFELLEYFTRYSYLKSDAAACALILYRTAYLKTHYPLEFQASLFKQHGQAQSSEETN